MKWLTVLLVLLLTGCDSSVSSNAYTHAQEMCNNFGGVSWVSQENYFDSYTVDAGCKNGMEVSKRYTLKKESP